MKLTGELKNKVEKSENMEEAKKIIEEAGFELTDDEVNAVVGGVGGSPVPRHQWDEALKDNPELYRKLYEGSGTSEYLEYEKRS